MDKEISLSALHDECTQVRTRKVEKRLQEKLFAQATVLLLKKGMIVPKSAGQKAILSPR